jgi:hypothetical protein
MPVITLLKLPTNGIIFIVVRQTCANSRRCSIMALTAVSGCNNDSAEKTNYTGTVEKYC